MGLQTLDYIIIVICGLSAIIGFCRGFVREFLSLLTLIVAFFIAVKFSPDLIHLVSPIIKDTRGQYIVTVVVVFFAVVIIGSILGRLLTKSIRMLGLGVFDRFSGFLFGIGRGCFIVVAFLFVIQSSALADQSWTQPSVLASYFSPFVNYFDQLMPVKFVKFEELLHHPALKNLKKKLVKMESGSSS